MDEKENTLRIAIVISSAVLFLFIAAFAWMIAWYYRKRKRVQNELEERNLNKIENERRRIANDLEKTILPIMRDIDTRLGLLKIFDVEGRESVRELKSLAAQAIGIVQQVSVILLPVNLEENGLISAFRDLASGIEKTYHLQVHVEGDFIPRLPIEAEVHIYRIAEEVLENIVEHAKATQAFLNISSSEKNLTLIISDDGKGLDLEKIQKENKALGLRNILVRTDLLGGEAFVEGKEGGGTTYLINIPI